MTLFKLFLSVSHSCSSGTKKKQIRRWNLYQFWHAIVWIQFKCLTSICLISSESVTAFFPLLLKHVDARGSYCLFWFYSSLSSTLLVPLFVFAVSSERITKWRRRPLHKHHVDAFVCRGFSHFWFSIEHQLNWVNWMLVKCIFFLKRMCHCSHFCYCLHSMVRTKTDEVVLSVRAWVHLKNIAHRRQSRRAGRRERSKTQQPQKDRKLIWKQGHYIAIRKIHVV